MTKVSSRRRWKWWQLCLLSFVAVVIVFFAYGYGETYWIRVKEYTFTSADLPAQFDGTRVVLITDIHRGPFFSQARVRSLVERVNRLEPDLIILGGDYVYRDTRWAPSVFAELRNLQAPLGRFAVLGNHDYGDYRNGRANPGPLIDAMQNAGITLLRNSAVWLEKNGSRIRLGGVADIEADKPDLGPVIAGTTKSDFVLLVSHEPDFAETLPAGAADLTLSGHTHGGQITFFGLAAFHVPSKYGQKYRTGMINNGLTTVVVSNGIGTSGLPIRVFARPQIVVITLHRGNPQL